MGFPISASKDRNERLYHENIELYMFRKKQSIVILNNKWQTTIASPGASQILEFTHQFHL